MIDKCANLVEQILKIGYYSIILHFNGPSDQYKMNEIHLFLPTKKLIFVNLKSYVFLIISFKVKK